LSLEAKAAQSLASSSAGSIARAIQLSKSAYLGMRDEVMEIINQENMQNPLTRLSLTRRFGEDREEILERLGILRMCYRDILFFRETGEKKGLINRDRMDIVKPLAEKMSVEDVLNNIKIIDGTSQAIELYADKTLALEVMMLSLVS